MPNHPHRAKPLPLLSIPQAAEYAGVSSKTIRRRIAEGHLRASRMNGSRLLRIAAQDLDALFSTVPTGSDVA